jgi:SnoaL-like domain
MLTQEQLQELYDKQCLHDNLMAYCRGIDRFDRELIQSTYWPDSTDDHGVFIGGGWEWAATGVKWKDTVYSNNHHVTNVLIEIQGNRAKRESMFLNVVNYKSPAVSMFLGGRYRDLCEKRNDQWKILRRTCVWDWSEKRTTKPAWDLSGAPEVSNWGAFAPDDPIYQDWGSTLSTKYPRPPAA